jgi:hypothetical protein
VVIDLTQSDDDDMPTVYSRVPRGEPLHEPATRGPLSFPVANHRLTIRDSNVGAGQEPRKDNNGFDTNSRPGFGTSTKLFGGSRVRPVRFPRTGHAGFQRLLNNENRLDRPEQYLAQAASDAENGGVPLANMAKRRKMHGGMTTTLGYEFNAQGSDKDQANGTKSVPSRETSVSSNDSTPSVFEVSPPQPPQIESRTTSQLCRTHRSSKVCHRPDGSVRASEERVIRALEMHVLKHVKNASVEYRRKLPRLERAHVTAKVRRPYFLI